MRQSKKEGRVTPDRRQDSAHLRGEALRTPEVEASPELEGVAALAEPRDLVIGTPVLETRFATDEPEGPGNDIDRLQRGQFGSFMMGGGAWLAIAAMFLGSQFLISLGSIVFGVQSGLARDSFSTFLIKATALTFFVFLALSVLSLTSIGSPAILLSAIPAGESVMLGNLVAGLYCAATSGLGWLSGRLVRFIHN